MLSKAFLHHTRMKLGPEMVKGPLDCVRSDSCTSLSVLGLNPRTSFIKVKSHPVVCLGCGISHTHFCCPMQSESSFQTFTRSKQAIWLLTTNESLLVTPSFLYVWYKGLVLLAVSVQSAKMSRKHTPTPCLKSVLDRSFLEGDVLGMSNIK